MATKPRTFMITARDLAALIRPALALACTDDNLPVINAVRLEARGTTITASATDRFRAGMVRHVLDRDPTSDTKDPQRAPGAFAVTLPASAVRLALATFKPGPARVSRRIKVTVRASATTLEAIGRDWPARMTLELPHLDGQFPDIRSIILKAHAYEGPSYDGMTAVNPTLLASFAAVQRSVFAEGMTVGLGPNLGSPIALSCGDHFLGLLMPRRLLDQAPGATPPTTVTPEWAELLAPDTTTTKAA
jgi:hypothetical protein